MRCDDELCPLRREPMNDREERQLPLRRSCCLGLVENVETIVAEAIRGECKERLAMGLLVERGAAMCISHPEPVDLGGDVKETLGAKEVAIARTTDPTDEADVLVQLRLGAARVEVEVSRAALGIESGGDRDRLDQRGLAGRCRPRRT